MSEPSRYGSVPKQGDQMSTSIAAKEAFELLNAATQKEWRGWGDTRTAARDRAAKKAGLTPAQAERLWKNWQTTKFPNADVYRLLRNTYGHLCAWVENAADAIERETRGIEENNAFDKGHPSMAGGGAKASQSAERST